MTFRIIERPSGLFYELFVALPSGRTIRERRKSRQRTRAQLQRWLLAREQAYLESAVVERRLGQITPAHYTELQLSQAKRSPRTVNNVLGLLAAVLQCAKANRRVHDYPQVPKLQVVRKEPDHYSEEQTERLIEAAAHLGADHLLLVSSAQRRRQKSSIFGR